MRHLFTSGNQNTGASASSSVLPVNIQGLFPLGLTGLITTLLEWVASSFSRGSSQPRWRMVATHGPQAHRCQTGWNSVQFNSLTQSCTILWPHGLQYTRLPCPSPSPQTCWNSCPLSQQCYPTISSFVIPFSLPASGSFPMSQLFTSGRWNIGGSASTSVLPMNIQGLFPLGLTGLIWPIQVLHYGYFPPVFFLLLLMYWVH